MRKSKEQGPDNPEEAAEKVRQRGLQDIRNLGPHKPMGYLPLDTLVSFFHSTPKQEIENARRNGFRHLVLSSKEADIGRTGALFVYDEKSLRQFLEEHQEVLRENQWPTDPEGFIRKVAKGFVPRGTPLRTVVDLAFGDKNN